jgi:hypothetical protein
MGKALLVICMLAVASPASAQQAASSWVRLSLNDGRFVDGYITGGDAASYFVQTSYGYFSIARGTVIAVTPMSAAPVAPQAYAPTQPAAAPAYAAMTPPAERSASSGFTRGIGLAYFGISYGVVALAASAKTDDDDSAKAGFIPVVGPILWAWGDDSDDVGEDGWDWLALVGTITQGAGLYGAVVGGKSGESARARVTAVSTKSYSGLSFVGTW